MLNNVYIYYILESEMLTEETSRFQLDYLRKDNSLTNVLYRMDAVPWVSAHKLSPTVGLDNITFGPQPSVVEFQGQECLKMKVITYCLLYVMFQSKNSQASHIYQNTISYIFSHSLSFPTQKGVIEEEQLKSYYISLFLSLESKKGHPDLLIAQLTSVPQMGRLMLHLLQTITGQLDLNMEINCTQIQHSLKEHLGFQIECLSGECFVLMGQLAVDVSYYPHSCLVAIREEDWEAIRRLRDQHALRMTACFPQQEISIKNIGMEGGQTGRSNVKKMGTAKSIGFSDKSSRKSIPIQKQFFKRQKQTRKLTVQPMRFKARRQSLQKALNQFDALINSSHHEQVQQIKQFMPEEIPKPTIQFQKNKKNKHNSAFITAQMSQLLADDVRPSDLQQGLEISLPSTPKIRHQYSTSGTINRPPLSEFKSHGINQTLHFFKSQRNTKKHITTKADRVPSFILNRRKAKGCANDIENGQSTKMALPTRLPPRPIKPSIKFSYVKN